MISNYSKCHKNYGCTRKTSLSCFLHVAFKVILIPNNDYLKGGSTG